MACAHRGKFAPSGQLYTLKGPSGVGSCCAPALRSAVWGHRRRSTRAWSQLFSQGDQWPHAFGECFVGAWAWRQLLGPRRFRSGSKYKFHRKLAWRCAMVDPFHSHFIGDYHCSSGIIIGPSERRQRSLETYLAEILKMKIAPASVGVPPSVVRVAPWSVICPSKQAPSASTPAGARLLRVSLSRAARAPRVRQPNPRPHARRTPDGRQPDPGPRPTCHSLRTRSLPCLLPVSGRPGAVSRLGHRLAVCFTTRAPFAYSPDAIIPAPTHR